jgi:hypothetical protein
MKLFENQNCWVIEDYLDLNLISEIKIIIKENLDNLYKDKEGYSTTGKNSEQYWLVVGNKNFFTSDIRFYEFEKKYMNEILTRIKKAKLFCDKKEKDIKINPTNAWSVVGEEGSYHTIHNHNEGSFDGISTLVYLEVPETNCEKNPENKTYIVTNISPHKIHFINQNLI